MTASRHGRRAGLMTGAVAALLLFTGCTGTSTPEGGGQASNSTATASAVPGQPPASSQAAGPPSGQPQAAASQPAVLTASKPVSLTIPSAGVDSTLLHLGLREDGALEVPPVPAGSPASWFTGSPTPGERGPAVLLGHVNATGGGAGVFANLRTLKPGDRIEVAREDGTTAVFTVDRGEQYGKDSFPTLEVYGNTEDAELRLITCDGFDAGTGTFEDNYVVYASLAP